MYIMVSPDFDPHRTLLVVIYIGFILLMTYFGQILIYKKHLIHYTIICLHMWLEKYDTMLSLINATLANSCTDSVGWRRRSLRIVFRHPNRTIFKAIYSTICYNGSLSGLFNVMFEYNIFLFLWKFPIIEWLLDVQSPSSSF